MGDFKKDYQERVKKEAKKHLANHSIKQRHRDDDTVKLWTCSNNGSSIYRFSICHPPGWLFFYGDMGEVAWSRSPDMIEWARNAVHSEDYFASKVSRSCVIEETYPELADEWLNNFKKEMSSEGVEWTNEMDDWLSEVNDAWTAYNSIHDLQRALYESKFMEYLEAEDIPSCKFYTYHYLWSCEAIKWFLENLKDAT